MFGKPISMGIVLGADSCRYAAIGGEGPVYREPSVLWIRRATREVLADGGAIGDYARSISICKNVEAYREVRPFGGDVEADRPMLAAILRYFRRRLVEQCGCRKPSRLVVTGRSSLLKILRHFLDAAAREAGFRECACVDEYGLMAAWPDHRERRARMVVDVGHTGARVRILGDDNLQVLGQGRAPGGSATIEGIMEYLDGVHDIRMGYRSVRELLAETDNSNAWPRTIKGRDNATGLPRAIEVSLDEISAILRAAWKGLLRACDRALSDSGYGSAREMGIVLAGGASAAGGLRDALSDHLGAPIALPPEPGDLSARVLASNSPNAPFGFE